MGELSKAVRHPVVTLPGRFADRLRSEGFPVFSLGDPLGWLACPPSSFEDVTPDSPVDPGLLDFVRDKVVLLLETAETRGRFEELGKALCVQVQSKGVLLASIGESYAGSPDDALLRALNGAVRVSPGPRFRLPGAALGARLIEIPFFDRSSSEHQGIFAVVEREGEEVREVLDVPFFWAAREVHKFDTLQGVRDSSGGLQEAVSFDLWVVNGGGVRSLHLSGDELYEPRLWRRRGFLLKGLQPLQRLGVILEQLRSQGDVPVAWTTSDRGWVFPGREAGPAYIYGDRVLKGSSGLPLMSGHDAQALGVSTSGTLREWADIIEAVLHNPAVAFLLGLEVSAALLRLLRGMEPAIVTLFGPSGCGKTTALLVLASAIGSAVRPAQGKDAYINSWRATSNALEGMLAAHSDAPLLLDEVHQAAELDWTSAAYMIANGGGKARARSDGENRGTKTWACQVVASGEMGLLSKVLADRGGPASVPAGLLFRAVDLRVSASTLWSDVAREVASPGGGRYASILRDYGRRHGEISEQAIIEAIEAGVRAHHGQLWPVLIEWLQAPGRVEEVQGWYDELRGSFEGQLDESGGSLRQIVARRVKHVAAGLTGLKILETVLGVDGLALGDAYLWAGEHFWRAGLEDLGECEDGNNAQRVEDYILSHLDWFEPHASRPPSGGTFGWIVEEKGRVQRQLDLHLTSIRIAGL